MTNEEFEKFLQIAKLTSYAGHRISSRYFFEIPDEWLLETKNLIEELITTTDWNKVLLQCKEKFNTFRFYIDYGDETIYNIIDKYSNIIK